MSTAQAKQQPAAATTTTSELDRLLSKSVKFKPFAEEKEIELSFGQVKNFISARTRSGATATDADIIKFMMLCQARALNPWVGDAYLVGYDSKDGPTFSLITSVQALMKRAEAHPQFDGLQSGVIIRGIDGKLVEREGDLVLNGEQLIGGWAKCYRKDRSVVAYDALNLGTYDKGRSQWEKDKSGMIVKCAEASVLRRSFPSQLAGLYTHGEQGLMQSAEIASGPVHSPTPRTLSDLASAIQKQPETVVQVEESEQEPDPLDAILEAIIRAKDEAALTKIYDAAIGPDATVDLDDNQRRQVEAARADRLAVLREGAK